MEKFWNQEFWKPKHHPKYPKSERNSIQNFFRYQICLKPIPFFFRYLIFLIPNPILFPLPNLFDTESETINKNGKVSKLRSCKTETSHSGLTKTKIISLSLRNYKLNGLSNTGLNFINNSWCLMGQLWIIPHHYNTPCDC